MPSSATGPQVEVVCPGELRSAWPHLLAPLWAQRYPQAFDADDLRLALNQPEKHFYDWVAAIHLVRTRGVHVLVEKYGYTKHPRKNAELERVLRPPQVAFLRNLKARCKAQPPDLFLYRPDGSWFGFTEVKGPRDRLKPGQRESHRAIQQELGTPVEMVFVAELARPRGFRARPAW